MISDFEKEKVFWTKKMNLKLVKFIESRPNIWNPKHPKYTSVDYRDKTYSEFALKYGNDFTGQAVKDRWTNIRSTFATYWRKLNASRAKSDGEEYKVTWHLWEPCQFLTKVNKKVKLETPISDDIGEEEEDVTDTKDQNEEWLSEEENEPNHYENEANDTNCRNIADNLVHIFRNVQHDSFGLDNTRNGNIGRMVAKKLSQMSSFEAASVSQRIMDILLLYNENNPANPNNM